MNRVDTLITQLTLLNEKAVKSSKKQVSEQDARKVFDPVCAMFPKATSEERVDILIAFEDRELLIEALLAAMLRVTQQANRYAQKDKRPEAIIMIQQALILDALVDGRTELEGLHKIQDELLKAAKEVHYDVTPFLQSIETHAGVYVERAYAFQKQHNRIQAIRCLGRALQLDHTLRLNDRIGEFAALLTGEPAYSAVMLLEDSFLRHSLIKDIERQAKLQARTTTQVAAVVKNDSDDSLVHRVLNGFSGKRS